MCVLGVLCSLPIMTPTAGLELRSQHRTDGDILGTCLNLSGSSS